MTRPAAMGRQPTRQAASADRVAQRSASHHPAWNASNAAHRNHHRRRRSSGLLGRLAGLVFGLVFLAVVAGIFLFLLSQTRSAWFEGAAASLANTF